MKEFTFLLLLGFKARERWAEEAELGCNWFVLKVVVSYSLELVALVMFSQFLVIFWF